ncbi:helix-turn-helix domain-containing protein [Streptomyces sp. NPDC017056]|uniref:helix-turn-helix domain-containing protein n=1 Tax=Streptomyces sp. NPDC017056 TaxID=3364973 RepID=UPI0037AB5B53
MDTRGNTDPAEARDVTEFLALLRELKERRGLTYRQLEQRAAEQGEVLARSTLADVLGGRRLPRPEVLAVFVRACGDGEQVAAWLDARENVAARSRTAATPGAEQTPPDSRRIRRLPRIPRVPLLLVSVAVLALAALTAWMLTANGPSTGPSADSSADHSEPTPDGKDTARSAAIPAGWVRIRPAVAPALCVTDGLVQDGRYDSLVAVQRPCGEVAPQRTRLERAGTDTYRIKWVHPARGEGCLTVLSAGRSADGLLEARDACEAADTFRVDRAPTTGKADRYVFRAAGQQCLGVKDARTSAGTEVMLERCTGGKGQTFHIEPAPTH